MNVGFLEQFHMWAKKKKIFSSFIPLALFCFFLLAVGPIQMSGILELCPYILD